MDPLADVPNLIDLDEWKARAAKGEAPADAVLRKQYVADEIKAEAGDTRKVKLVISTSAVDRHRDTVDPQGIEVTNYLKNPVVLWAHSYRDLPIARGLDLKATAKKLTAVAEFVPGEISAFADTVYQMVKGAWLNAASIGFRALKDGWTYIDERGGYDFAKTELLEFSIVPVPANPQALVQARSAGVPMAPLKEWAERILDGVDGPGLWVPKDQALAVFKQLSAPAVPVPSPAKEEPPPTPDPLVKTETFVPDVDQVRAVTKTAISEAVELAVGRAAGRLD